MRDGAREHGKFALADRFRVADRAINDKACDLALRGMRGHDLTNDRVALQAAGVHDNHVARCRHVDRLVHHQVVARRRFHGKGAAKDTAAFVNRTQVDRAAGPAHDVADIGDGEFRELPERGVADRVLVHVDGKSELRHVFSWGWVLIGAEPAATGSLQTSGIVQATRCGARTRNDGLNCAGLVTPIIAMLRESSSRNRPMA